MKNGWLVMDIHPLLNMRYYILQLRIFPDWLLNALNRIGWHPIQKNPPVIKSGIVMISIYQKNFLMPTSKKIYVETCQLLFKLYEDSLPAIIESLTREYVDVPGESPARKERIILTAAGDVCRFLLPVSAFANVGMTINARALEHAITKMLSHPLLEVQSMGREIKAISQKNIPTLLKYANEQPSLKETAEFFASNLPTEKSIADKAFKPGARLVDFDTQLETKSYRQPLSVTLALPMRKQAKSFLDGTLKPGRAS